MAAYAPRPTIIQASSQSTMFCNGLERIEDGGGGCLRFILFENKEIDGRTVRVELPFLVVMPLAALPDAIGKAIAALGRQVLVSAEGILSVMH